jgi:pimeloyl-ACP methyl ester carboxylesterase
MLDVDEGRLAVDAHQSATVRFDGAAGPLIGDRFTSGGSQGPLLMLHGGGQTRHSWHKSARILAKRGSDVFTVDAAGHGRSAGAADGGYTLRRTGRRPAARGRRDRRPSGPDPTPMVVGASMGGITALLAEGDRDGVSRSLVLVDIVPRLEMSGLEGIGTFMTSARFSSVEEVADAAAAYQPHERRPDKIENVREGRRSAVLALGSRVHADRREHRRSRSTSRSAGRGG